MTDAFRTDESKVNNAILSLFPGLRGNPCRLHFLLESSRDHGFGLRGSFSTSVSTAVRLHLGELSEDKVAGWAQLPVAALIGDPDFNQTFKLAWQLEIAISDYNASGAHSFIPLISSYGPVAYWKYSRQTSAPESLGKHNLDYPTHFDYSAFRLTDIYGTFVWPIDFCLIYSGLPKQTGPDVTSKRKVGEDLQYSFALGDWEPVSPIPITDNPLYKYTEALAVCSRDNFRAIYELLYLGNHEDVRIRHLRCISVYQHLLYGVITPPKVDHVLTALSVGLRKAGIAEFGLKTTGSGGGGAIVISVPLGELKDKIGEVVQFARDVANRNVALVYASWLDGCESRGVLIEQFDYQKAATSLGESLNVNVTSLNPSGEVTKSLVSSSIASRMIAAKPFVLDAREMKVYVNGKGVGGAQGVQSQPAIIHLIQDLISRPGEWVSNTQLSEELVTYKLNRNEMKQKVIKPFSNIVSEKTLGNLNLEISRTKKAEFSIALLPGIEITLLTHLR